jgi:3-(3-hydroxy-phenyl)propionate hydroxylase
VAPEYEVIVVGYGPTGVCAANFLGSYGIRTLVLEREPDVYGRARAVTVDDFTLRLMQQVGLDGALKADMDEGVGFSFRTLRNNRQFFLRHETASEYGQPPICMIYQPAMEDVLRKGVERFREAVDVRLGCDVTRVENLHDSALVHFQDEYGNDQTARAQYVFGCDGGSSRVRQSVGIPMVGEPGGETWIVIDAKVKKWWPGREHVKSWYHPKFPAIDIPLAMGNHRWEFPLPIGQTRESMRANEGWWPLIERLGVMRENVDVVGHAFYQHNEMSAQTWVQGRTYLLGDAAHMMSPWAGQGMQSGIRDAHNLSWKLNAILRHGQSAHILDTYEAERAPHVKAMTDLAHRMGAARTDPSEVRHQLRVAKYFLLGRTPIIGQRMKEFRNKPAARVMAGFVTGEIGRRSPVGFMIPQPRVARINGVRAALDDVLGPWINVIGVDHDPRQSMTVDQVRGWEDFGARFIAVLSSKKARPEKATDIVDYTDALVYWMRRRGAKVVVVRPDKFVAAADCTGLDLPVLQTPTRLKSNKTVPIEVHSILEGARDD